VLAGSACKDETNPSNSVRKYCVLTSMPHTTPAELRAMQAKALELFKQKQPYQATDANRAVVNAASQLSVAANTYAIQIEKPEIFPGQEMGVGFPQTLARLTQACAALPD
jgi:hypothetical protein